MIAKHGSPSMKKAYALIRVFGFLEALAFPAAVLAAGDTARPDSDAAEERNLLKNGAFETVKEQEQNLPAAWGYYGGKVPGDCELAKPGREGKNCVRCWSDKPGYHGGIHQAVTFEGNRRYRLSAWVKANLTQGARITLLYYDGNYDLIQDGQKTAKYWGGNAGEKKDTFDWEYVEKTFETPADAIGTFGVTIYPVLFYEPGEVWMDDVRWTDLGPASLGKEVCSLSSDDLQSWKLSAHVNEVPADLPEGVGIQSDEKHPCDGKPGLKLNYRFASLKHDAVLLTGDVSVSGAVLLALRVYGDASGHELDAVLFDKSGEAHYLPLGPVYWRGWKTLYKSLASLCEPPAGKWDVSPNHWDGDGNQTLEFPITRITLGLNDQPDTFKGKGEITFGWMKLYE